MESDGGRKWRMMGWGGKWVNLEASPQKSMPGFFAAEHTDMLRTALSPAKGRVGVGY